MEQRNGIKAENSRGGRATFDHGNGRFPLFRELHAYRGAKWLHYRGVSRAARRGAARAHAGILIARRDATRRGVSRANTSDFTETRGGIVPAKN